VLSAVAIGAWSPPLASGTADGTLGAVAVPVVPKALRLGQEVPAPAQGSGQQDHGQQDHGQQDHGQQDHGQQDHGQQDHGQQDHGLSEPPAQAATSTASTREALEQAGRLLPGWTAPVKDDYRISAPFGASSDLWRTTHTGTDLAAPTGTPVLAASDGTIVSAGWDGPYGRKVELRHRGGTVTTYGHLSAIAVEGGDVQAGKVIGRVGSTGNSTGPHLHFEVRPAGGELVDPEAWLSRHDVDL
jgi:murein DD-endopeptidase MepM/ murein hydrolase activator NlpD